MWQDPKPKTCPGALIMFDILCYATLNRVHKYHTFLNDLEHWCQKYATFSNKKVSCSPRTLKKITMFFLVDFLTRKSLSMCRNHMFLYDFEIVHVFSTAFLIKNERLKVKNKLSYRWKRYVSWVSKNKLTRKSAEPTWKSIKKVGRLTWCRDIYIYICVYRHTQTHTHVYVYIYIYISIFLYI